jgi:coiled-coil domain-containing protein 61
MASLLPGMEQVYTLPCHGEAHTVLISFSQPGVLRLEVESQDGVHRWSGDFAAQYIEEITHKTGNFKRFEVFVSMLCSALAKQGETVTAELLTYADLEALKARRSGSGPPAPPSAPGSKQSTKRYFILTYSSEFDRVHYPLPLAYQDAPDAAALLRVIARLRDQISTNSLATPSGGADSIENSASVKSLKEENARLRSQVKARGKAGKKGLEQEVIMLQAQLDEAESNYDELRTQMGKEIRRLRRKVGGPGGAGDSAGAESPSAASAVSLQRLRSRVQELEVELEDVRSRAKKSLAKAKHDCDALGRELTREKNSARALRSQLRESQRLVSSLEAKLRSKASVAPAPRHRTRTRRSQSQGSAPRRNRSRADVDLSAAESESRSLSRARQRSVQSRGSAADSDAATKRRFRRRPASSRGSSPAGSQRSSASAGPLFDPTAYQREREMRLKAAAADKRRREEMQMSHRGLRASSESGRTSWIPRHASATASSRQRSMSPSTRAYGASGYASAGSASSRHSDVGTSRSGRRQGLRPKVSDVSPEPPRLTKSREGVKRSADGFGSRNHRVSHDSSLATTSQSSIQSLGGALRNQSARKVELITPEEQVLLFLNGCCLPF